ncbi:MAG: hypothetical protein KDC44_04660, partial [Phaeodactylibacter sp.]|nr:hypothetical protein [Phaeodactylibacter sp.]
MKQLSAKSSTQIILLICIGIVVLSCNRQQQTQHTTPENHPTTFGKIVSELSPNTMTIFQDSKNNYWFGSHGLIHYDGQSLRQYTTDDGLYSNRIRGIQEDHLGNLLIDTGEGVNKFDGQHIEKLVLSPAPDTAWVLRPDDLWFEGYWDGDGPLRYDGRQLYALKFPKHALEDTFYMGAPNANFSPYQVYKTFRDSKGNIWFGSSTFGACRFDGQHLTWISERDMTEVDPGPAPGVRSILEDQNGNFRFSSNVSHAYSLIEEGTAPSYQQLAGIETSTVPDLNHYCMAMTQDADGAIWLATHTS